MSIKLANKFLETNKHNEKILRKYDRKSEEYELVPKLKNRRISSVFHFKERKMNQFKFDCITTLILYYTSFILGLVICGHTLAHKEFDQILESGNSSVKTTTFTIGFVFGSLISSITNKLFGRQRSAALFLSIICVTQVLTLENDWFILAMTLLQGCSSGALFVTLIVWIINIWRDKSWPYLQTLFFFKFLATFLEPVIQKQYIFVTNNMDDLVCAKTSLNSSFTETTGNYLFDSQNNSNNNSLIVDQNRQRISLENSCNQTTYISNIPQICTSFLAICGAAFLLILFDSHNQYIEKNRVRINSKRGKANIFTKRFSFETFKSWKCSFFIVSISLLISLYLTNEFSNIKLMSIYWHRFDPKLNDNELSLIRITLYGSQALFASIFIFISIVLKPQIILMLNLFITTVANLTLILFANNSYQIIIIVCALMGCGFSSSPATIYAILGQYIDVDNNIGSIVVGLSAIIYITVYEICEKLIEDNNTLFYICLNFVSIFMSLLTFAMIWSSKFFINSDSFNLKTPKISVGNGCSQEYNFDGETTSEYKDTFCSTGSYQPRDTSIVSI